MFNQNGNKIVTRFIAASLIAAGIAMGTSQGMGMEQSQSIKTFNELASELNRNYLIADLDKSLTRLREFQKNETEKYKVCMDFFFECQSSNDPISTHDIFVDAFERISPNILYNLISDGSEKSTRAKVLNIIDCYKRQHGL